MYESIPGNRPEAHPVGSALEWGGGIGSPNPVRVVVRGDICGDRAGCRVEAKESCQRRRQEIKKLNRYEEIENQSIKKLNRYEGRGGKGF
jgi:hypothetical protein